MIKNCPYFNCSLEMLPIIGCKLWNQEMIGLKEIVIAILLNAGTIKLLELRR